MEGSESWSTVSRTPGGHTEGRGRVVFGLGELRACEGVFYPNPKSQRSEVKKFPFLGRCKQYILDVNFFHFFDAFRFRIDELHSLES